MHVRTIAEKTIHIGNGKKQYILKLFQQSYQVVLENVQAVSNTPVSDHQVLPGGEKIEKSSSHLLEMGKEWVSFVTGIDLSKKNHRFA